MKGIFTGDWHYGLTAEDIDRTPEIHKAVNKIVDYAIEEKVDFFSIGGDSTDNNTPHPDDIRLLINILNRLEDAEIVTFLMRGNHEATAERGRLWGLTPLEEIGYANIHFITEPKVLKMETMTFLFLPHITQNQCKGKRPQTFLEEVAADLLAKASGPVTAITHFNHDGATPGTEAMRLRQSDLCVPAVITKSPKVIKVVNSHVHTPSDMQKVIMPGSVVCTAFGDMTNKRFLSAELKPVKKGLPKWKFTSKPTAMAPLEEITFDFADTDSEEREAMVDSSAQYLTKETILRVRIQVPEELLPEIAFDDIKKFYQSKVKYLKTFDRVIGRKRSIRDAEQVANMPPLKAVERYIDQRSPEGADRKLRLAKRILTEGPEADIEPVASFQNKTTTEDAMDRAVTGLDVPDEDDLPDLGLDTDLGLPEQEAIL